MKRKDNDDAAADANDAKAGEQEAAHEPKAVDSFSTSEEMDTYAAQYPAEVTSEFNAKRNELAAKEHEATPIGKAEKAEADKKAAEEKAAAKAVGGIHPDAPVHDEQPGRHAHL